jgi:sporulation integral membrane protein YtvI
MAGRRQGGRGIMISSWFWRFVFAAGILFLIPYSWPLLFALGTAAFLEKLIVFIIRSWGLNRFWAVLLTFVCYIGGLLSAVYFAVSVLAGQIATFAEKLPRLIKELYYSAILPSVGQWDKYSEKLPANVISSAERAVEGGIRSLEAFLQELMQGTVQLAALVPGFFIDFLIYVIALFLFCLEFPLIRKKAKNLLKETTYQKISLVCSDLSKAAIGFLKAQVFLSFITFLLAYTGLWILGVPFTLLLAILIILVDILPILGTGSMLVPWAVIAIIQGNGHLGIGLIILFISITVIRRIIEPKVYSANLGLTPIASLISLYLGLKLMGFIGLFIGPAAVIVFETLKKAGFIKLKIKM